MKVLIIEDKPGHLQAMQAVLIRAGHEVFPSSVEREKLNEHIIACFETGVDVFYVKEATDYIQSYIDGINPDLVLVDYELKENTDCVIGTSFIETFLEEKNIVIVTGQTDSMLNNDIIASIGKPYPGTRREVCFKDKDVSPKFLRLLMEKVKLFENDDEDKAVKWREQQP
ncbi:CheY-like chemotaxis protein [Pedobacter sp. W3I1]|uniref:hypothetical protein n=1 Tax=Pedobacter sp. W3I1 TaxID=3042291 RepID=UPI00278B495C|nr:hypothetical protein [Pedobacter sp. W3I1]MDQ0640206.1 CheY-like chemotaxis protein [Pedobacter sp. W3I1]